MLPREAPTPIRLLQVPWGGSWQSGQGTKLWAWARKITAIFPLTPELRQAGGHTSFQNITRHARVTIKHYKEGLGLGWSKANKHLLWVCMVYCRWEHRVANTSRKLLQGTFIGEAMSRWTQRNLGRLHWRREGDLRLRAWQEAVSSKKDHVKWLVLHLLLRTKQAFSLLKEAGFSVME